MLADLLAEIASQEGTAEPVVPLELFFDGNDDPASIGCNLSPHPGVSRFASVLGSIRSQSSVHDVLVGIEEVMGPDEWPFSWHVYVVTTASAAEVAAWAAELRPETPSTGWDAAIEVPSDHHVVTLWWD
ncbi:hypothetical protein LWC34_32965 [Kibdelosporangium philippinense]|uniref:DUF695 domain-containing protein n=1 Tax=Kibdelosporangium philippinense TaxID=211113 RepID=A0ABS8ZJJ8_9PSEU|nr:hypothetical protein [Kibdelosporangium philippinense]MCE7007599.1 hypothetical protein [Kibdelosporangium philippinense]